MRVIFYMSISFWQMKKPVCIRTFTGVLCVATVLEEQHKKHDEYD
jgi:hypothetical protein